MTKEMRESSVRRTADASEPATDASDCDRAGREPIHDWFELSYAQYIALPRSLLQSMPTHWQERFVGLMDELSSQFYWNRSGCFVRFRTRSGKWMHDPLSDYERGRRRVRPQR